MLVKLIKLIKARRSRAPKQKEEDYSDHHQHLLACVKNAQDKLEEYYKRMQESPVYAASVVLNPQHKQHWFNFHWKAKHNWIEKAERIVENMWLTKYKPTRIIFSH